MPRHVTGHVPTSLHLTSCGMLYLDFVDACRNGYSGCVEKCIQLFAIMLQGTKFRNYAGETLHMMACFRRLWKPEFRLVSIFFY